MFFKTFQTRQHRRVFFWLILFCAECVVGEWVETDCLWLIGVEGFGDYRSIHLSVAEIFFKKGSPEIAPCDFFGIMQLAWPGWTYGLELCIAVAVTVDMAAICC